MAPTLLSLQCCSAFNTITVIVGIIGLLKISKLIYVFRDLTGIILSMVGITIIVAIIIMHLWFGIFGNNALFSFINDLYPFINNHCSSITPMVVMAFPVYISACSIFILLLNYYVSKTIQKQYRLNDLTYAAIIPFCLCTCFIFVFGIFRNPFEVNIIYAANSNKYKQCNIDKNNPPQMLGINLYGPIFPFTGFVCVQVATLIFTIIICIKKVFDYIKYSNTYNTVNLQIKYMLYLAALSFVLNCICVFFEHVFEWQLYGIPFTVNILCVIYGIDIYYNNKYQNNNLSVNLLSKKKKYIIFPNTINNHPWRFDMEKGFTKNAWFVYQTLCDIFNHDNGLSIPIDCIIQLISEFAATIYLPCIKCGLEFGFIECTNDYAYYCGVIAQFDANNNVLFYVNTEPNSWRNWEQDEAFDEEIEILCVHCALKLKCSLCLKQALLDNQHEMDECVQCKSTVCSDCSRYSVCENCDIKISYKNNGDPNKWKFNQDSFRSIP